MNSSMLKSRVRAVNTANKAANDLFPLLADAFRPFIGQKIEKTDGGLLAKVEKSIPGLPYNSALQVFRNASRYSLNYTVKVCVPVPPNTCVYHDVTLYVAEMNGATLGAIKDPPEFRTDYTESEVLSLREEYKAAKRRADDALSALYPFGEYDR